jgi:hypothetical protein
MNCKHNQINDYFCIHVMFDQNQNVIIFDNCDKNEVSCVYFITNFIILDVFYEQLFAFYVF